MEPMKVTLSVSVPANWVDNINERVAETGKSSRSEYVRGLIEDDIEQDDETNVSLAVDGNGEIEAEEVA